MTESFNNIDKARKFEAMKGDHVIRKIADGQYECIILGSGMWGSGLVGKGYSPMDALRSHNYLVWDRMDKARIAKDAQDTASRALAREAWRRGRSFSTIFGDVMWGRFKNPPRNPDGTTREDNGL